MKGSQIDIRLPRKKLPSNSAALLLRLNKRVEKQRVTFKKG